MAAGRSPEEAPFRISIRHSRNGVSTLGCFRPPGVEEFMLLEFVPVPGQGGEFCIALTDANIKTRGAAR
jgi:hypothetical protein